MFSRCVLAVALVLLRSPVLLRRQQPAVREIRARAYTDFERISIVSSFTSVNSSRTNLLSFFMDAQECADLGGPITLPYASSGGENSLTRRCLVFDPARMAALWLPGTTVNVHFGHRYNEAEPQLLLLQRQDSLRRHGDRGVRSRYGLSATGSLT